MSDNCFEIKDGFICTLEKDHKGNHKAFGSSKTLWLEWNNKEIVKSIPTNTVEKFQSRYITPWEFVAFVILLLVIGCLGGLCLYPLIFPSVC